MASGFSQRDDEAALKCIKDVIAAHVVRSEDGHPAKVHVLARSGRSPRLIAKDVASVVLNKLGYSIDPRVVSVALIREGLDVAASRPKCVLSSIKVTYSGPDGNVEVEIKRGEEAFNGAASGRSTAQGRLKTVAEATLSAFLQAEDFPPGVLEVEEIRQMPLGDGAVVMVSLSFSSLETEEIFYGTAMLTSD